MNVKYSIEKLIDFISDKIESEDDLLQISKFLDQNEFGLAFEWICASIVENDLKVSSENKKLLIQLFDYLKDDGNELWEGIELEEKLNNLKLEDN